MCIFGSTEPQSESNFPFLYIIRFWTYWSLEARPPLVGEMDMCAHWLFCTKHNAQTLLFEQFFNIFSNFDSSQPENESTFQSQYTLIFETY